MPPYRDMSCCRLSSSVLSWAKLERNCWRGFQLCKSAKKELMPGTAASCSTKRHRQGEKRNKASSSLYLDELLIQKCKFRDRFTRQLLAWKGFPRRVHATLTNPAWITHLLRNIFSNYWCGMHRTCKNTSVKPDRKCLMIRGEKNRNGSLQTDCDSRTGHEVTSKGKLKNCLKIVWKRHAGSGLSRSP